LKAAFRLVSAALGEPGRVELTRVLMGCPGGRMIIRTLVILAVALVWGRPVSAQDAPPWEIQIEPADQVCTADADCGHVTTRCDNCNDGAPVNRQHVARYHEAYEGLCRAYRGAHCARASPVFRFVCRDRRCAMAPFQ
jgi:hypothetical protein